MEGCGGGVAVHAAVCWAHPHTGSALDAAPRHFHQPGPASMCACQVSWHCDAAQCSSNQCGHRLTACRDRGMRPMSHSYYYILPTAAAMTCKQCRAVRDGRGHSVGLEPAGAVPARPSWQAPMCRCHVCAGALTNSGLASALPRKPVIAEVEPAKRRGGDAPGGRQRACRQLGKGVATAAASLAMSTDCREMRMHAAVAALRRRCLPGASLHCYCHT